MRVYMAELIKLVKQEEQRQLFKKLFTGLIEISDFIKKFFYYLVDSNYTIKKVL
jgi:hypothetical protein